jgi:hypothetical protein
MIKFPKNNQKIRKSVIKKQLQTGETVNLFNEPTSKKEAKNLFGNTYNKDLITHIYQLFEKDNNGNTIFNVKNEAQYINLNKNPKSFRKPNLTQNIKGDRNNKTYKPIYNHLNLNGNTNILIRDNEDNIKNISKNALYDVNNIHLELIFEVSDQGVEKRYIIPNSKINEIKQILQIPLNNKLLPNQIFKIIDIFLRGDEDNNIDGYFSNFPNISNLSTSCFITVKDTENNNSMRLKLKRDGDQYYLYSNIRNYTDMKNIFENISTGINIPHGRNCVIETLKYIYNNLLPNGNKRIFKKELENIEQKYIKNNKIPTYKILVDFLETTKTNFKIFNWTDKNDSNSNIFDIKKKIFNFIVYNSHLYLIENDNKFEKIKNSLDTNDKYLILNETKFNNKFNNLLKEKTQPKIIKINKEFGTMNADITSYEDNKIIYVKNDKNNTEINLLYLCQMFNIVYNPYITESNFIEKILTDNKIKQTKSFYLYNHSSKDIIYSENIPDPENFITFDYNKYYSNILLSLDKIPIVNNLIHKTEKYNGETIDDNYFYSIEILDNNYNLWFKNDELFFGKVLNTEYYKPLLSKMIKENKLKIVDKIKCEWIGNYYKPIIEKLFEIVEFTENKNNILSTIKNIINKTIGKFQLNKPDINEIYNNIHIEENNGVINYHHNDNENYYNYNNDDKQYKIFYVLEEKKNNYFNVLENHRPLRTLILNLSWLNMLKFVVDNNIDDIDIFQINTDSLTIRNLKDNPNYENNDFSNSYLDNNNKKKKIKYNKNDEIYYNGKYNKLIEEIEKKQETNKYNLYGVKIQEFKKYNETLSIIPNNISFIEDIQKHNNKFVVNLGYAGSGKSYKIDILIKQFKEKKQSYILLAPLVKVLKLYDININKNTVQHYFKNNKIPIEENIIIDEFYLINSYDMRYIINWLYTHKKNIYLYGDIFQLPPIFNKCNKQLNNNDEELNDDEEEENEPEKNTLNIDFLKSISTEFYYYLDTDENKRNNFNFDVYDKFIKNEYTEQEQKKIINHFINNRCDTTKKYINICYRNYTKNEINNEYLLRNNQQFNKNNISGDNIPLISKKNYKVNDDIIICAKDEFILSVNDNKFLLSFVNFNNNLITFEMEQNKIFKLFNVAYCLNLYNIQGQTLTNFNYILDDVYFLNNDNKYNIKGAFYTLISRIKEPLTNNKITSEDINNILIESDIKINNNNNNIFIKKNIEYKFGKNEEKNQTKKRNNTNIFINIQ